MSESGWVGKSLLSRYQVKRMLGQGGMAEVYEAYDPNLSRTVAIKLIHPHLASDPGFLGRFEREARAIARLRHPNIVQVYDFNHEGDTYFMVMEYVDGPTLQDRLRVLGQRNERLPLTDVIDIMIKLSSAIHYAHTVGMVHRDLKPSNILFTGRGEPVVTDFGLARILGGASFTATGAVMGTPLYMAPEQGKGEGGGEASDVYSLGVILFEMSTGTVPYEADTPLSTMMKHITDPIPSPLERNPQIPPLLADVIVTALAKTPADRFKSAEAMATALALAKGRLASARSSPALPRPPVEATTFEPPVPQPGRTVVEPYPPPGTQPRVVRPTPESTSYEQPPAAYRPPPAVPQAPVMPANVAPGAGVARPAPAPRRLGLIGIGAAALVGVICLVAIVAGIVFLPGLLPGAATAAPTVAATTGPISLPEGVLFQDDFSDPGSGWPTFNTDVNKGGYHPPDAYHLEISGSPGVVWAFRQQDFSNFSAEAQVFIVNGEGSWRHGLAFRQAGDGQFYALMINPNEKTWQALKRDGAQWTTLAEGSDDSIHATPNEPNTLRVDADGDTFVFSINGHGVGSAKDGSYGPGDIGFVLETFSGHAHIHWDNLTVRQFDPNSVPVIAQAPTTPPEATVEPATEAPTEVPTEVPVATIAATLPATVPEGMVEVPAGEFIRGVASGTDNSPERHITLKSYFIDVHEVTNAEFTQFFKTTGYQTFFETLGRTTNIWRLPQPGVSSDDLPDNPVVFVVWDDANAYCQWAGQRLPTEAEWEKAARGPDGHFFPWGNDFDPSLSNSALNPSAPGGTMPVGSFPQGASVYGVMDMSGNVWEMVNDLYSATYFANSPDADPPGPTDGVNHVTRGGGWRNNQQIHISAVFRDQSTSDFGDDMTGFRCAQDAP